MHSEFRRTVLTAVACVVAAPGALDAQSSQFGSISGTVTDKNTKQPIEAVTVIVNGTSYGILTKANGTYTILGVPPGTFSVTAKRVGYQEVTAQNVVVRADISRTQDFELSASATLLPLLEQASARLVPMRAMAGASAGPGSAFGIDAYDCANCGIARYRDSTHAVYTFSAEPVVVTVSPQARDRIRPGDVIVAVNGQPITTRAGADLFAYPDSGEIKLTLRRNGTNIDVVSYSLNAVRAAVAPSVAQGGDVPRSVMGGRGGASAGGIGGRGGVAGAAVARGGMSPSAPTLAGGSAVSSTVQLPNYGFSLTCRPDCTRMRSQSGVLYWKFEGYPSVAVQSVAKDGLAAKVGIREGDVVVSVNGLSPLTEEGAVLLNRTERELELTIEISRAGKREKFVLKL